jgi:hypothetical protein
LKSATRAVGAGGLGVVLGKHGCDEGGDDDANPGE